MSVITDLINSIDPVYLRQTVTDVLIGLHWTMVTARQSGLAATLSNASCCHAGDIENVGHLHSMKMSDLVNLAYSSHPLDVSVGMAAVNSLLEIDENSVIECNAREILIDRSVGKNVAIIGHFPFVDQLRKNARNLWILELEPGPDDLPANEYVNILPKADVIGMTATTLMNGTFDSLSSCFPEKALVVMMGPSTPMSSVLFDHGVHILAGSKVRDRNILSRYIGQGTTLHGVEELQRITIAKKSII